MAVRVEPHAEPIPGYKLIERLGGGGFGEVWKAEAPGGLHKAIKFVYGDLAGAGDDGHRAEQELKAMRRVQTVRHPYILSLERYDVIDGQLLIVMELADRNLWDRYRQCRSQGMPGIPFDELIRYMEETAEALDLMNGEYQLQHLDIKPQNLFLVHNHIKVADFGLVKDLEGMVASVTGGVTPVYAAPETFDGYVSRFSDQYSLAIVYQELLTGSRPFQGGNVRQLILQHLQASPDISPLPRAQQPVIARALSKKPEDRYPSCGELVSALRESLRPPAPAPSWPPAESPSTKKATVPGAPATVGEVPSPNGRDRPADESPAMPSPRRTEKDSTTGSPSDEALDLASDVTAGEVTPSQTHCFRAEPEATFPTDEAPSEPIPVREEVQGDGTLFPSLILGLGQTGLAALQQFRAQAQASFGGVGNRVPFLDRMPQLRTLLIDTDPEVVRLASQGAGALPPQGVVLTPLNRPSYYLKPSSKRAPTLESWLNLRMLYRIPRSQVTTGVRALGRLAFCDHYRSLARRLHDEIEACLDPEALQQAAEQTGLGLRTNRPRVYLITSLAGGTGSGMFLDVAYTLRALLKRAGFAEPDIVAVLLLPPVLERTPAVVLGNAYAALKELLHYADPLVAFRARYHEKEAPVKDPDPPFSRCVVLPLPEDTDEAGSRQAMARIGEFLCRDLFTPLGRALDRIRIETPTPPQATRGRYCQTFNLYPITWPRAPLVEAVCRRLCGKLVEGWASKQSTNLVEPVREWIRKKWAEKDLAADRFLEHLQEGLEEILGQRPETYLETCLRALTRPDESDSEIALKAAINAQRKSDGKAPPERGLSSLFLFRARASTRAGNPAEQAAVAEANAVKDALGELTRLLGRTTEDGLADVHGEWNERLGEIARKLTENWIETLSNLAVRLIEEPGFRLAGAEEGLRQMIALIEQILQTYEPMAKEMRGRTQILFSRLAEGVAAARSPDRALSPGTLERILRAYGKARYQCMVMHQAVASFLVLRGHLSDELREINYCRARLRELHRRFTEKADTGKTSEAAPALGKQLFAEKAETLEEAAEQQMDILRPEDMFELDRRMERMFRKRFRALAQVCTSNVNNLSAVERSMLETAQKFVSERLPEADVAQMFLDRYPDQDQLEEEILTCVEQAEPFRRGIATCLSSSDDTRRVDVCLLTAPPGPAGERFANLANPFLANAEVHYLPYDRDLIIYRERLNLKLTDLEQFGPQARKAYVQMSANEHFTLHIRLDEPWPDLESQAGG